MVTIAVMGSASRTSIHLRVSAWRSTITKPRPFLSDTSSRASTVMPPALRSRGSSSFSTSENAATDNSLNKMAARRSKSAKPRNAVLGVMPGGGARPMREPGGKTGSAECAQASPARVHASTTAAMAVQRLICQSMRIIAEVSTCGAAQADSYGTRMSGAKAGPAHDALLVRAPDRGHFPSIDIALLPPSPKLQPGKLPMIDLHYWTTPNGHKI